MIQIIAFLVLAVLGIVAVTKVCILAIYYVSIKIRQKANSAHLHRLKRAAIGFAVLVILNAGLVAFSQITASTPSITDEKGSTPENSITELKKIELNGRNQWISIRGFDKNKPVLLFLAGGPGGTQMAGYAMNSQSWRSILLLLTGISLAPENLIMPKKQRISLLILISKTAMPLQNI